MASNNYIYKMSNAGGMSTVTRYVDMLAGNTTWQPWEPAGAYDALATVTVPSGGAASISFAGIPAGYKHLQLRQFARGTNSSTNSDVTIQFNGDTAANYTYHQLYGDGTSATSNSGANQTLTYAATITGANGLAGVFGAGITDILDYANINKFKTIRTLGGNDQNGGVGFINFRSGLWRSTSAISSIVLTATGGNFAQNSQFALYGIR